MITTSIISHNKVALLLAVTSSLLLISGNQKGSSQIIERPGDGTFAQKGWSGPGDRAGNNAIIDNNGLGSTGIVNPGTLQGFNPQPEPPGQSAKGIVNPGTLRGFNPQPEPPGHSSFAKWVASHPNEMRFFQAHPDKFHAFMKQWHGDGAAKSRNGAPLSSDQPGGLKKGYEFNMNFAPPTQQTTSEFHAGGRPGNQQNRRSSSGNGDAASEINN